MSDNEDDEPISVGNLTSDPAPPRSKPKSSSSAKKHTSKTTKAGLTFPVARIARMLKKDKSTRRVGSTAPVFMAGVLEYLAAEVLEITGNVCRQNRKKKITPRHMMIAIRTDLDLDEFSRDTSIDGSGCIPNIPKLLAPKKSKQASGQREPAQSTPEKSKQRDLDSAPGAPLKKKKKHASSGADAN